VDENPVPLALPYRVINQPQLPRACPSTDLVQPNQRRKYINIHIRDGFSKNPGTTATIEFEEEREVTVTGISSLAALLNVQTPLTHIHEISKRTFSPLDA
jgi:hypothetical protein